MGKPQSKVEETINNNLAVGVDNSSHMQELKEHVSLTNCILIAIVTLLIIGALFIGYRIYKKCHGKLIQREVNEYALRRYASLLRRQSAAVPSGKPENIL